MDDDPHGSDGERALQRKVGSTDRAETFYKSQMRNRLNSRMRQFVARMEMMFVSTSDRAGNCDCSIRCGLPGFVQMPDDRRLIYPEYRGNGVMASLGNLTDNPHVGLLFVDFFKDCIGLHVNGAAAILEPEQLIGYPDLPVSLREQVRATGGRRAERWVEVHVHEAYIHCSKHLPLLEKRAKKIQWGTDDFKVKGGDYFDVANDRE